MDENTPSRWNAGAGSRRMKTRVEVWSGGIPLSLDAPILDGQVVDVLATGTRRTLSLSCVPSVWIPWFDKPRLEVRPYRGFVWGTEEYLCPMGRFPITLNSVTVPASSLDIQADDYFSWIVKDTFPYDTPAYSGSRKATVSRLISDSGLGAVDTSGWSTRSTTPQGTWDKSKAETWIELVEMAGGTGGFDRDGQAFVIDDDYGDVRELLTDGATGTVSTVNKVFETGVYNYVSVYSSNPDVQFAPVYAEVTNPANRAHRQWIGRSVYRFASPLFSNRDQAVAAANSLLNRVSRGAETYEVLAAPDPRRDAGDVFPFSYHGESRVVQATRIVTPLKSMAGRYQQLTLAAI